MYIPYNGWHGPTATNHSASCNAVSKGAVAAAAAAAATGPVYRDTA